MPHLPAVVCHLVAPQVDVGVWEVAGGLTQQAPNEAKSLVAGGVDGAQLPAGLPAATVVALRQQPRVALPPATRVACSRRGGGGGGSAQRSTLIIEAWHSLQPPPLHLPPPAASSLKCPPPTRPPGVSSSGMTRMARARAYSTTSLMSAAVYTASGAKAPCAASSGSSSSCRPAAVHQLQR